MKRKFKEKREFLKIVRKYQEGTASQEERAFLEELYAYQNKEPDILDQFSDLEKAALEEEMEHYILRKTMNMRKRPFGNLSISSWQRFATAASVLFCIIAGMLYFNKRSAPFIQVGSAIPKDFAPGKQRAILTLANGSEVTLDSAKNGHIATQGNSNISKNGNGKIAYQMSGDPVGSIGLNTITTPAGGQYTVVLPDGSQVWLNARSSVTFPTAFAESERKVTLKGECYFEIKKDKSRPFIVNVNGRQQIVVTGTHFNVKAYENEPDIRTTLLEGAVNVAAAHARAGENNLRLVPGEQSVFNAEGQFQKSQVDVNEVVAWRSGFFQYRETALATIMRDIERWYNVEVVYAQGIPQKQFSGKLRRDSNASGILEILRLAGVNFRIEASEIRGIQGKIVVLPTDE